MGLWTFSSRRPRTGLATQEANSVQHTSHLTVNITQSQSWRHSFVIYHTPISSQAHISQVIALQPYISAVLYVKGIYIYKITHVTHLQKSEVTQFKVSCQAYTFTGKYLYQPFRIFSKLIKLGKPYIPKSQSQGYFSYGSTTPYMLAFGDVFPIISVF